MVFKPSATLREHGPTRLASGDKVFRVFLALAVVGCVWSTLIQPQLPVFTAWVQRLVGA